MTVKTDVRIDDIGFFEEIFRHVGYSTTAPYLNVAPVALELHPPTKNKKMSVSAETPPRFIIICPRVHSE